MAPSVPRWRPGRVARPPISRALRIGPQAFTQSGEGKKPLRKLLEDARRRERAQEPVQRLRMRARARRELDVGARPARQPVRNSERCGDMDRLAQLKPV